LRAIGLIVAIALAGVAAWLIVTGDTSARRVQAGVLIGIWGGLLAAFCLFDARRSHQHDHPVEVRASGAELELRSARTDVEKAEEAAARRAHEARLEQLLRAEVQSAINREIGALRAEIAELRSELLEKVGNQVRLERIETTRVIGSDLEALQHEVRQLQAAAREVGDIDVPMPPQQAEPVPLRPVVEPARVRPVSRESAELPVEVQPAGEVRAAEPEPQRPSPAPEASRPAPSPAPDTREAVTLPLRSDDPFSGLPRIEPFTDFALEPVESVPAYTGRRRRSDGAGADAGDDQAEERRGRRHRDDEDGHDLLARLLAREGR
jgi:hypothetical protein